MFIYLLQNEIVLRTLAMSYTTVGFISTVNHSFTNNYVKLPMILILGFCNALIGLFFMEDFKKNNTVLYLINIFTYLNVALVFPSVLSCFPIEQIDAKGSCKSYNSLIFDCPIYLQHMMNYYYKPYF